MTSISDSVDGQQIYITSPKFSEPVMTLESSDTQRQGVASEVLSAY